MNITFLVGNGFDINLGIDTSYNKFIEECGAEIEKIENLNRFYDELKKQYDTWGDLELAIGKMTSSFTADDINDFLSFIGKMCITLNSFLKKKSSMVPVDKDVAKISMEKIITSYHNKVSVEPKEQIEALFSTSNKRFYNFIIFNYTNILDVCIDSLGRRKQFFQVQSDGIDRIVNEVIHIHGEIDAQVILGLNDTSQIANENFLGNKLIADMIVKPNTNDRLRNRKNKSVKEIIMSSNIIYIYGMSLGDTDKQWWECIGEWLKSSNEHHVIINVYDKDMNYSSVYEMLTRETSTQEKIIKHIEYDEELEEQIRRQMHIVFNDDLFDIPFDLDTPKKRLDDAYRQRITNGIDKT